MLLFCPSPSAIGVIFKRAKLLHHAFMHENGYETRVFRPAASENDHPNVFYVPASSNGAYQTVAMIESSTKAQRGYRDPKPALLSAPRMRDIRACTEQYCRISL